MVKNIIVLCLLFLVWNKLASQEPKIEVGGYIDTYIATDDNQSDDSLNAYRMFNYVNPKKNQFAINTAQISAKIKIENTLRSIITLHAGDLHKTAYANAGDGMPVIQQANGGFRIYNNFWLDGGFFLTHIGGEALLPKDNWLSSHSLVTFYEPFYEAGVRGSYETDKLTAQLYIVNGSGIFDDNNYNKTLGLYVNYIPDSLISLSYAAVVGNEEPGLPVNYKLHQLHNFVVQLNPVSNLSLKAQLDLGKKDVIDTANKTTKAGTFIGVSLTAHYQITKAFSGTVRTAYVDNSDGVYSSIAKGMEFTTGVEYKPTDNSYIRLEGRMMKMNDNYKLFLVGNSQSGTRKELVLNMGIWIN